MIEYIKDCGYRVLRNGKRIALNIVPPAVVATVGAAVGAAAEVLGAAYGTGAVELLTAVPAALAPYAIPILGATLFLAGYGGLKYIRNQSQPTINVGGFEAQYRDLRRSMESNERREFNLTEYNPQYWSAATDLLREKFRQNRDYSLERIVVRPDSVRDLQRLLNTGLGRSNARHLEICDTTLGNSLVYELYKQVNQDGFLNIETLILRNNAIPPTSLARLNEIGRKLNLRTLDISGNNLTPSISYNTGVIQSADFFKLFISNFHKNFTSAKRLLISNVNSDGISLDYISELWAQPSLLESVDISENGMGSDVLTLLLNDPKFQYNVNIREIQTGCNRSNRVRAALDSRAAIIDPLRRALGETQETKIVTTIQILERLRNESAQPLPNELIQFFARTISSNGATNQTLGIKWRFLAEKLNAFRVANNPVAGESNAVDPVNAVPRAVQIENLFIEFRRHEGTDQDFLIDGVRRRLEAAQPREEIVLSLSHPYMTSFPESAKVVEQLENGLETLYNRFRDNDAPPVIRKIDFPNIGITTTEFSSLLTAGLGDYDTVELNLENNKLDDECISELAEPDTVFSKLKFLNLSRNSITQNGLVALANFCRKAGVESLNISGNALCGPKSHYSDKELGQFLASLHTRIPTLRVLNISNIGLTQKSLSLLLPLIQNISLLEEVDAGQSTIKRSDAYAKFYNQPAFLNNLILRRFDMGNVNHKNIREKIVIRENLINTFRQSLPEAERGGAILPALLTKYLMKDSSSLPAPVKTALGYVVESKTNLFSNGNKMEIMAKSIGFHRDKARITDDKFEIPQRVTAGEIAAYNDGELTEYWSNQLGQELATEGDEITKLWLDYQDYCKDRQALKAIVMANCTSGGEPCQIYYAEDNSIRVYNNRTGLQDVYSRYLAGKYKNAIGLNIANGVSLLFNPNGNVQLQVNDRTSYIYGYEVFSAIPCEIKRYEFYKYKCVADLPSHVADKSEKAEISDDIEDDEETIKPSGRPMTHQYATHRQAANQPTNQSAASSSSSSSSRAWPSISSSSSSGLRWR